VPTGRDIIHELKFDGRIEPPAPAAGGAPEASGKADTRRAGGGEAFPRVTLRNGTGPLQASLQAEPGGYHQQKAKRHLTTGRPQDLTKSKCRPRQEFVVCGYTPPKSSLPAFSSLVLGTYENGKLIPRGKVGSGFSDKDRADYLKLFERLET